MKHYSDLHLHLSAGASTHTMWEIAHQQGIRLEEKNYWEFMESFKVEGAKTSSWETYHHHYDVAQLIQSSPLAIERTVYETISLSYRKSQVDLLEIRFNPMRRNQNGLYDLDRLIFSAIVGMKRAMLEYPIKVGLIIEMDRRFSPKQNKILIEKAIKHQNEGIVGVDISGPEVDTFDMQEIIPLMKMAKDAGLGITIHTGEYIKPTNKNEMKEVLEQIKPNRIGHGIQAAKDDELLQMLVDSKTVLEICPTSNVTLGNVSGWEEMGQIIHKFLYSGVILTINSDGPVFLETNVKEEFKKLEQQGVLSEIESEQILSNAKLHTFIK